MLNKLNMFGLLKIKNFTFQISDKVRMLLLGCIVFSLIYFLLDDSHFSGLNKIQETIKQELIKKEVQEKVGTTENPLSESFFSDLPSIESWKNDTNMDFTEKEEQEQQQKEIAIEEKAEDVKEDIKELELDPQQITPNMMQQLFNRFYFSISTGCLLGFGDIYPITNISKTISILQALFTVSLILS